MKRDESSVLVERQQLSPDAFLLHFESETLSRSFLPGQFTMLRVSDRSDLLLRRPYSFCDSRPEDRSFSLLVKIAGKGTKALTELPVGGRVDCLGPLGSSFRFPRDGRKPVVVAGGVGIAPFVAFCRELAKRDLLGAASSSVEEARTTSTCAPISKLSAWTCGPRPRTEPTATADG